jgi:predicted aspartyl protease
MGVFHVDCTVENIAARERSAVIVQLLVDTGSEFTWLPADTLARIGVDVRKRDEQFVMANGGIITRDIGYGIIRVDGFETVDEIVFANEGDLNLLGARTLEGFGAVVDARRKRLVASGPHLAA